MARAPAAVTKGLAFGGALALFGGLYCASLYSFLLFHSIAELFSIVVACGMAVVVWNSRRFWDNGCFLLLGIGYLFVGGIDLVHTLAYTGMGVFAGYGTDLPAQLWLSSRLVQSATLFLAPFFLVRKLDTRIALAGYSATLLVLLLAIFYWHIFPTCYMEGTGLTAFKVHSEYVICGILLASIIQYTRTRRHFERNVWWLLIWSVIATIASELAFTLYRGPYGSASMIGHYLEIISFCLIYKAAIQTTLAKPYSTLFRDLREQERALRQSEERFRSLVETTSDWLWEIDANAVYVYASPAVEALLGYKPQEVVGKRPFDLMPPGEAKRIAQEFRLITEARRPFFRLENTNLHKDGRKVILETSGVPIFDAGGAFCGYRGIDRDVTDRKRSEEALQLSHSFLEIANRHSEVSPLLKEFVAEIKNATDCQAVGIRLLDKNGRIPYESYVGFNRELCESENPLSTRTDKCMCTSVIDGKVDPKLPFYTEEGSFYINGDTKLIASVHTEQIGRTCNVCNKYGYESVALIPVRVGKRIVGLIHVADRRENAISPEVVSSLESAAIQLGTALQRARAEEELQRAKEELEKRVKERTVVLTETVEKLESLINQRKRLEEEVLRVSELERHNIGRDLHDSLGQTLIGASCLSQVLHRKLAAKSVEEAQDALRIESLLRDSAELTRSLARGLSPVGLKPESLMQAMKELASNMENMFAVQCVFRCHQPVFVDDNIVATHLYRIAQEACNNAIRHGKARKVAIDLALSNGAIVLSVLDDGVGLPEDIDRHQGMGLSIMKYRAESIGASISIQPRPEGGTAVVSRLKHACRRKRSHV